MKLYNGTGSHVILIGTLTETPSLKMNAVGDYIATMSVRVVHPNQIKPSCYFVVAREETALRIRQFGLPGLKLLIEGQFSEEEKSIKIIAEKITFLDGSDPNSFHTQNSAKEKMRVVLH